MNFDDEQYRNWLSELKLRVRSAQAKAAIAVNSILVGFYRELGKRITERENVWGSIPWGHNILIFSRSKGIDEASSIIFKQASI